MKAAVRWATERTTGELLMPTDVVDDNSMCNVPVSHDFIGSVRIPQKIYIFRDATDIVSKYSDQHTDFVTQKHCSIEYRCYCVLIFVLLIFRNRLCKRVD